MPTSEARPLFELAAYCDETMAMDVLGIGRCPEPCSGAAYCPAMSEIPWVSDQCPRLRSGFHWSNGLTRWLSGNREHDRDLKEVLMRTVKLWALARAFRVQALCSRAVREGRL